MTPHSSPRRSMKLYPNNSAVAAIQGNARLPLAALLVFCMFAWLLSLAVGLGTGTEHPLSTNVIVPASQHCQLLSSGRRGVLPASPEQIRCPDVEVCWHFLCWLWLVGQASGMPS